MATLAALKNQYWNYEKDSLDFRRFSSIRKKVLDTKDKLLYNIRTGVGDDMYTKHSVTEFTQALKVTAENDSYLSSIYERVVPAAKEAGYSAVIAGGAVRDTLLGVSIADIDVFLSVPEDEDLDDANIWFNHILQGRRDGIAYHRKGGHYSSSPFVAFSSIIYSGGGPFNIDTMTTRGSAEEICNTFDYSLVKAYYDGEYHVHSSFLESLKTKRIPTDTASAFNRASYWRNSSRLKFVVGKPPKSESPFVFENKSAWDSF